MERKRTKDAIRQALDLLQGQKSSDASALDALLLEKGHDTENLQMTQQKLEYMQGSLDIMQIKVGRSMRASCILS